MEKGSYRVRIYFTPDKTDKGEIPYFTTSYYMNGKRYLGCAFNPVERSELMLVRAKVGIND